MSDIQQKRCSAEEEELNLKVRKYFGLLSKPKLAAEHQPSKEFYLGYFLGRPARALASAAACPFGRPKRWVVVMAIQGGVCIELLNHARQNFDPNLSLKVTL